MKNFEQLGDVLTLTAPSGGVVGGNFYGIGAFLVCASVTAAAGEKFAGKLTGVFSVTKATGQTWSEGEIVYFDDGTGSFTTSAVGNAKAGAAVAAALTGDTTGLVRLDGVSHADFST